MKLIITIILTLAVLMSSGCLSYLFILAGATIYKPLTSMVKATPYALFAWTLGLSGLFLIYRSPRRTGVNAWLQLGLGFTMILACMLLLDILLAFTAPRVE